MPLYEYVCDKCGEDFEELVFSSQDNPSCPKCGFGPARKKISSPARRRAKARGGADYSPAPSSGGCAGCSDGNCGSCGA